MIIKGSSGEAAAIEGGRLLTDVSMLSEAALASIKDGNCYSWNAVTAALADLDTAIMVCNNDPEAKLYIESLYIWVDVPSEMDIHFPAYATWAGTAITGVNLNRTSAKTALATAIGDETGQATQGTVVMSLHTNEATADQFGANIHIGGAIVLGYHQAIAVDVDSAAGAAAYNANIIGYYK